MKINDLIPDLSDQSFPRQLEKWRNMWGADAAHETVKDGSPSGVIGQVGATQGDAASGEQP